MFAWIKNYFYSEKPTNIRISINKIVDDRGEHIDLYFDKSVRPSEYIALINDILSKENLMMAADIFDMQGNNDSAREIQDSIAAKYIESTKEALQNVKLSYLQEEVVKPSKGLLYE